MTLNSKSSTLMFQKSDGVSAPQKQKGYKLLKNLLWRKIVRKVSGNPNAFASISDVVHSSLPRDVGAEITNICNANCSFCGYGKGEDGKAADPRKKGKLSKAAFQHLLKLYSQAGGGNFSLSPILGEISAHPNWLDLIKEARSYPNITGVSCFTNAILLDRFGYENILRSGLTAMSISTSLGSREQYVRLYGVDKYDIVVQNVLGMIKANFELKNPVSITLLLRIDKPYEPFFSSDLYESITRYLPKSSIIILDDFWDDFHGLIGQDGLPKGHHFKTVKADKHTPCYAMFRKLQVMTDGTLQACACRVEPELWGGNIQDYETLQEAWKDQGLEKLRADWFSGKLPECCKTCSHYMPYTDLVEHNSSKDLIKTVTRKIKFKIGLEKKSKIRTQNS